jgi:Tfp pilus assembly protein PilN
MQLPALKVALCYKQRWRVSNRQQYMHIACVLHMHPSLTRLVPLPELQSTLRYVAHTIINWFVLQVHEIAVQGFMAGMLLLSGNWFCAACHAAVLAYMLHLHGNRLLHVDTTDAFRQLPQQKKQRFILLGAHLLLFVLVVYR